MNQKRRKQIRNHFEELQGLIQEERECLDNLEEYFSEASQWQDSEEICSDAEELIYTFNECLDRWEE